MDIKQHRLDCAKQLSSPNFNERSDEADISLIVIHCISLPPGEFNNNYIDQLFCNRLNPSDHPYFKEVSQLKVSAHLLISRDGYVTQYVPFNKRAWHAGASEYHGRSDCNDFSIGIELEGTETNGFTNLQYHNLAEIISALLHHYPSLDKRRITGHSSIAPGRKTDPGEHFAWDKLFELLHT